ncbi:MAG: radical SAM protein [Candidatus Ornithomonoglobus sp.]
MMTELKKIGISTAYGYLEKDPEKNIPKLMEWVDRYAEKKGNVFKAQRDAVRAIVNDPESNWYKLIMRIMKDTDKNVVKTIFTNFFLNASLIGWNIQEEMREKYNCNIPWAILLDPTSACNLHCTGCWAAEYGNRLNLSFDEIDSIITQGKELGVYLYIYAGGEPLMRKRDIIALCQKHNDCIFLAFTNATLIDEEFAKDVLRVKNFIPAISIEGDKKSHDSRRGDGSYDKVIMAMDVLRRNRLPFGISCCYTSQNMDTICSDAFFDEMIDRGASFAWYFHYMPIGNDAAPALLPTPEQREYIYHKIREYRSSKSIFTIDFQNDGEYVDGCIAGGKRYLHINANGDVDPCVFVHYAEDNIRDKSLLDCLRSPLFMAYHDAQPFNENHLRPCPMLENPEMLHGMIKNTGAHSTDMQSPENVDDLYEKCKTYADKWVDTADTLWECSQCAKRNKKAGE